MPIPAVSMLDTQQRDGQLSRPLPATFILGMNNNDSQYVQPGAEGVFYEIDVPTGQTWEWDHVSYQFHVAAQWQNPQSGMIHVVVQMPSQFESNLWTATLGCQEKDPLYYDYKNQHVGIRVVGPAKIKLYAYNQTVHPAAFYFSAVWTRRATI